MIDAFRHVVHLCPADQRHVGRPMRNSWEVEGSQERERRLRHVFFGQTFSKTSDYFWWWTLKLKVIENFMFEREAHFESIKYVFLCMCIYALNWHIYIYIYVHIYIFIFLYMNLKPTITTVITEAGRAAKGSEQPLWCGVGVSLALGDVSKQSTPRGLREFFFFAS